MHKELKANRIIKGYSQKDLAEAVNMTRDTYGKSERGEREFSLKEAGAISNVLKVPIDVLFPNFFYLNSDKNAQ